MAADPEVVWQACLELLAAVGAHHGGTELHGDALPERRLVSPGAPAWDCPLVATWCERTAGYQGNPSTDTTVHHRGAAGFGMRSGTFVVTVVRPVAQGADEAAAQVLYTDATRVLNALLVAAKADELPGCHSLAFLDWRVVGPSGLMVAGELRIRIGLVRGA